MTVRQIGNARVNFAQLTIEGDAGIFSVEPKVLDVLRYLIAHHGEVIERDALIDEVWGVSYGGDERLSRAISLLRKALDDDARNHRYIQTIPKRGYRLVADVTQPSTAEPEITPPNRPAAATGPRFAIYGALVLFALAVGVLAMTYWPGRSSGEAKDTLALSETTSQGDFRNSIAILPFADLSPSGDQGYLAEGLAEELTNAITRFPDLRVVGQTSSFNLREQKVDPREVGEILNVRFVVSGSVRKQDDRLRVAAQLLSTDDGHVVWSQTYDGDTGRLLEFQESIAKAIARELDVTIATGRQLVQPLTDNQEAYDLFVQGRYLSRQFGRESKLSSLELLMDAVTIDPEFAAAWAWIGRNNMLLAISSGHPQQEELVADTRKVVRRALELDPNLADAHYVQALLFDYDLDLARSQDAMERAYRADPNRPLMINRRGHSFANIGLIDKADALLTEGVRRDPTDSVAILNLARIRATKGNNSEAMELVERSIALQFVPATGSRCALLAYNGNNRQFEECWQDLPALFKERYDPPFGRDKDWQLLAAAFSDSDAKARAEALEILNRFYAEPNQAVSIYTMDLFRALGAPELFMQQFVAHPFPLNANTLATIWGPDPMSTALRRHPDFPAFVERIGMVRAWEKYGWPPQCQKRPEHEDGRIIFSCR